MLPQQWNLTQTTRWWPLNLTIKMGVIHPHFSVPPIQSQFYNTPKLRFQNEYQWFDLQYNILTP